MNPLAVLFIILGILIIIAGFTGSYHGLMQSLKKL